MGAALFLGRDQIIGVVRQSADLTVINGGLAAAPAVANIDNHLLQNGKFKALKNNVFNF